MTPPPVDWELTVRAVERWKVLVEVRNGGRLVHQRLETLEWLLDGHLEMVVTGEHSAGCHPYWGSRRADRLGSTR